MPESSFLKDQTKYEYKFIKPGAIANPLLKKPLANQVNGDLRVGYVHNTLTIFGLFLKEIIQHILIFGRSGSGKTNLNRVFLFEFYRNHNSLSLF